MYIAEWQIRAFQALAVALGITGLFTYIETVGKVPKLKHPKILS